MSKVEKLFTELFRPQSLDMLIAPERIKSQLHKGLVQNVLLEGPPGTGKTSTAYILAGGKSNPNCMYVNASTDGRQEIIAELTTFCSTVGLFASETANNKKVVIFDEVDGASIAFFNSMKSFIEDYEPTTRFIMTCNVLSKVPDPIKSRMNVISYKPINSAEETYLLEEYKKRVGAILAHLKISYTDESITKFIKSEFPDMRKLMNKIQTINISGIKELNETSMATTYSYKELFDMCLNPPSEIESYKIVQSNYSGCIQECMVSLGDEFVQYIKEFHPNKLNKIPSIIVNVADYQHKLATVIDGTIALQALIFTLQNILK